MDFRWAAGIALWTVLSGPLFVGVQQFVPRAPASRIDSSRTTWAKSVKAPGYPTSYKR